MEIVTMIAVRIAVVVYIQRITWFVICAMARVVGGVVGIAKSVLTIFPLRIPSRNGLSNCED